MSINYDKYIGPKECYFQGKLPEIKYNLDKNNKFCDPYFKPSKSIINIPKKEELIDKKILKWERISNIINVDFDKSDEFLINQNCLGDCYLISFLRSLQIFQPIRYYLLFGKCFPEIGYYEIYFFTEDGEQVIVFVDDYILVDNNLEPYFAALKEEDIYTVGRNILIEKAYAKFKGSFSKIEGGNHASIPIVGIKSLQLTADFLSKENNEIYQIFKDELKVKNVILSGTINQDPNPISGLVAGHMYSLLSTEKYSDIKILELNNPYGLNYYEEMKNFKLGLNKDYQVFEEEIISFNLRNTNNGRLKIDIGNFKNHFDLVEICEFEPIQKEKNNKTEEKEPIPPFPSGAIDKCYSKRINILNALGIPKEDEKKFIDKCNGDLGKALYILFKIFLKKGTSKESFYNNILKEEPSLFQTAISYLNPLNWNWFSNSK